MNVAVLIGTRPEAIKMAPVIDALRRHERIRPFVISTGQHSEMLKQVLRLYRIEPDFELEVMRTNQTLGGLTGRLLESIDRLLGTLELDFSLVQGDTTTTFCGALASFYHGIRVGHVEAGLRTYDLKAPFPEEANRRMVSQLAERHFAPTDRARDNLIREGARPESILVTGNTVVDALLMEIDRQSVPNVRDGIRDSLSVHLGSSWWDRDRVLITGHRRESFGKGFQEICHSIRELADRYPDVEFVYPVHLNPNVQEPVYDILDGRANMRLIPPLEYPEFVHLMQQCRLILTDSGGVQEEGPSLSKPVLVMRETTERPEGVESGSVRLVGVQRERIVDGVAQLLENPTQYERLAQASNPYGDGRASGRIVEAILTLGPSGHDH